MDADESAPTEPVGEATRSLLEAPPALIVAPPNVALGDRYVVLDGIGEGGMAVVYAAFDRALNRKVAVKLLKNQAPGDADARLRREAQALARLRHKNVLTVYDVGHAPNGQMFVAMEFIEGGSLRSWLAREPRPRERVLAMYIQAGEGLAAAHAAGLVHRDFKPDNVLVDAGDIARVADFGLARELEAPPRSRHAASGEEPVLAATVTRAGTIMGTPRYMAPEQLRGDDVDARADQFAFGVALYESLCGRAPFEADSLAVLLAEIEGGTLPPRGDLPAWLYAVIVRALAADPEVRFPDMRALLACLLADPTRKRRRAYAAFALLAVAGAAVAAAIEIRNAQLRVCKAVEPMAAHAWNQERRAKISAAFEATGLSYAKDMLSETTKRLDTARASIDDAELDACEATRVRHEQPQAALDLRFYCLRQRTLDLETFVDSLEEPSAAVMVHAPWDAAALSRANECVDVAALAAMGVPSAEEAPLAEEIRARLAYFDSVRGTAPPTESLAYAEDTADKARALGYAPLEGVAELYRGVAREEVNDLVGAGEAYARAYTFGEKGHDDRLRIDVALMVAFDVGREQLQMEEGTRWATLAADVAERVGDADYQVRAAKIVGDMEREQAEAFEAFVDAPPKPHAEAALRYYQRAYDVAVTIKGFDPSDMFALEQDLAGALEQVWRVDDGALHRARAEAIFESLPQDSLGEDGPAQSPRAQGLSGGHAEPVRLRQQRRLRLGDAPRRVGDGGARRVPEGPGEAGEDLRTGEQQRGPGAFAGSAGPRAPREHGGGADRGHPGHGDRREDVALAS